VAGSLLGGSSLARLHCRAHTAGSADHLSARRRPPRRRRRDHSGRLGATRTTRRTALDCGPGARRGRTSTPAPRLFISPRQYLTLAYRVFMSIMQTGPSRRIPASARI